MSMDCRVMRVSTASVGLTALSIANRTICDMLYRRHQIRSYQSISDYIRIDSSEAVDLASTTGVTACAYLLQAFIAQDLIGDSSSSSGITAGPASFDVSNEAEVEQPFFSLR